jgi:hypothetical protein
MGYARSVGIKRPPGHELTPPPPHDISYQLVYRETTTRDRNWGITLSWALSLLDSLLPPDLVSRLQDSQPETSLPVASADEQGVLIRDGATGAVKIRVLYLDCPPHADPKDQARPFFWPHLNYGKKLVDLKYDTPAQVTAHFVDGSTETGSVVVGADTGPSQICPYLLGEKAAAQEVLHYAFMNFAFSLPTDKARWLDSFINPNVVLAGLAKRLEKTFVDSPIV